MSQKNPQFAMLIDTTLCVGCEECVKACRQTNDLGKEKALRSGVNLSDLSAARFTTIVRKYDEKNNGAEYVRRSCRHCLEPACASACIVGALKQTDEGPIIYDKGKCMGCRYCMMACPFNVPRYEWDSAAPAIRKCIFCYDKIKSGELKEPSCVSSCPQNVTVFGSRNDLLDVARDRIQKNPGKYFKDYIYGEKEVGGTAVMLISDIDLSFLSWKPGMDETALPKLTLAALAKVPPVILGMGAFATATYWIIGRRMQMQEEKAKNDQA